MAEAWAAPAAQRLIAMRWTSIGVHSTSRYAGHDVTVLGMRGNQSGGSRPHTLVDSEGTDLTADAGRGLGTAAT